MVKHYNHTVMLSVHGSSISQRENYLDLDPTYRDAWGQPLLRMTFDFPPNDLRMAAYVTPKRSRSAGHGRQASRGHLARAPYTTTQYQTTHNTGGTVMGSDPSTSVVNRYLQSWDVPNVFVIGTSNYPQNARGTPPAHWGPDLLGHRCAQESVS